MVTLLQNTNSSSDRTTVSSSNETNVTIEELNAQETATFLPVLVIYVFLMAVGIVGNTFVLIIYKWKFHRSSARVYIISLALADLSMCVVGIPYHITDLVLLLTYTYTGLCKTLSFLVGCCSLSSVFVLLVVGLDRYMKVCRPLKRQIVEFGDRRACIIAVIVAVIVSIPNAILYGQSSVKTRIDGLTGVECYMDDYYQETVYGVAYLGLYMLLFVVSVVYLIIIYGFICRKIYKDGQTGEIGIHDKRKWCSCTAPDTDSVDSYELENDEHAETMITDISPCQSPEVQDAAFSYKIDKQNSNGIEMQTIEHDMDATKTDNADGKVGEETPMDNEITNATNKKIVLEMDTIEEKDVCKATATRFATGSDHQNETEDEKEQMLKNKTTVRKSNQASSRKSPPKSSTKTKAKLRTVRSDTMIRHGMKKEKHTRKITLMMLTITVVFILSYCPYIVISILDGVSEDYWSDMSRTENVVIDFLLRLYLINNVANPIIYGFWDKRFRRECISLIRTIFCCGAKQKQTKKYQTVTSSQRPTFTSK